MLSPALPHYLTVGKKSARAKIYPIPLKAADTVGFTGINSYRQVNYIVHQQEYMLTM